MTIGNLKKGVFRNQVEGGGIWDFPQVIKMPNIWKISLNFANFSPFFSHLPHFFILGGVGILKEKERVEGGGQNRSYAELLWNK